MTIQEAREAALQGKTVTCPSGFNYSKASFSNVEEWDKVSVFGEWSIKQEPIVFEATVWTQNVLNDEGAVSYLGLRELAGKRVKVTVEVIE